MLVSFQLAIYMGFKEIFILGADLNFREPPFKKFITRNKFLSYLGISKFYQNIDLNHFDNSYGTPGFSSDVLNQNMLSAHELINKKALEAGVEIYNATIGGKLETYKRIKLEDLF